MAKIALISRQLSPSLIGWAEGLQQQQHQVRIITSEDKSKDIHTSIPIQFYFRRWSVFEALRLSARLLQDLPDIFHFIFQSEDELALGAHWSLLTLAHSLRRPVVTSLLSNPGKSWKWNPFLKLSDGVSFETKEALLAARRSGKIVPHQPADVLLPVIQSSSPTAQNNLEQLQSALGRYLIIPGEPDVEKLDHLQAALVDSKLWPVFWGTRKPLRHSLNYTTLYQSGPQVLESLVAKGVGILLCFHDFSPAELLYWKTLSIRYQIPLWIRPDQLDAVPGLCRHGKTGLVVHLSPLELRKSLQDPLPNWDFSSDSQQNFALETTDQTLNILSRLYARLQT